jgi:hypothetical protein
MTHVCISGDSIYIFVIAKTKFETKSSKEREA